MSKLVLKLEEAEVEALGRIIDSAMKATGIQVASPLAVFWPKFEEALKERDEEAK